MVSSPFTIIRRYILLRSAGYSFGAIPILDHEIKPIDKKNELIKFADDMIYGGNVPVTNGSDASNIATGLKQIVCR